jgi:hypothetical protein
MLMFYFISILMSLSVNASILVKSQIHSIDEGKKDEDTLVFLTTGQVLRLKKSESIKRRDFTQAQASQQWIHFQLGENHRIEKYLIKPSQLKKKKMERSIPLKIQEETYDPTVIENLELVTTYFQEAKYVDKESQCYNRAHIWSYEWFTKNSINSMKTWLFFTRRYIRKFKFDWWFHVSPSVRLIHNGVQKEMVMDVKYARGPLEIKNWTNIFMRDDANCPLVKTYSDYANYPESGSCFTMRTSMFYYQPIDIETKETWGTIKANWYDEEIKKAYLEAFDEVL